MLRILFPRRTFLTVLFALPLGWIFALGDSMPGELVPKLQELLFFKFFSVKEPDLYSVLAVLVSLLPILLGVFLLSGYFVADLSCSGAYLFTRIRRRSDWYFGKLFGIVFYAGIYSALYLGGGVLSFGVRNIPWTIDEKTFPVLIEAYALFTLFLILCAITVNLLSLFIPVNYSFLGIFVLILGSTVLSCLNNREEGIWLFRLSPVSHYYPTWHGDQFPFGQSLIYYGIGILGIALLGFLLFVRLDLSLEDLENR